MAFTTHAGNCERVGRLVSLYLMQQPRDSSIFSENFLVLIVISDTGCGPVLVIILIKL
jgi:hypothetical protein